MRALRYQLQPHFLFNTLNAISTLVLDNQPRIATQMIARLADLLRRTLESPDTHQVSLKEEIAVTKEYLALEKVRFGPRLTVTYAIDPETQEAQVPRFCFSRWWKMPSGTALQSGPMGATWSFARKRLAGGCG